MSIESIIQMYKNGYSVLRISKETGINRKTITDRLKKSGVYIEQQKKECPEGFLTHIEARRRGSSPRSVDFR